MREKQVARQRAGTLVRFEPSGAAQERAEKLWKECDILFLLGAAGTGKTYTGVGLAMQHAVPKNDRIVLTRPAVEASAGLGYLKGTLDEKYAPWIAPFFDVAKSLVLNPSTDLFDPQPLPYLRGRTFDSVVLLDESQNCTVDEIFLVLTRIGRRGKLILTGDPDQCDIENSGLVRWAHALKGVAGVGIVLFPVTQQHRHPLIAQIMKRKPR